VLSRNGRRFEKKLQDALLADTKVVETQEWIDRAKANVVRDSMKELPQFSEKEIERVFLRRYRERIHIQKQIALKKMRETNGGNRILSLSKTAPDDPKALLLWAHYTENHSGMVFEFVEPHAWVHWHDYKKCEPHNRVDVIYAAKRAGWNGRFPADEVLYTKSEHWIYEEEVRLIRMVGDKDFDTAKVDALVSFPPDLLRSVTLGVNNTNETEKLVRHALNANSGFSHVVLHKAELHPDEYRLTLSVLPR
jgi:hypothetical protein